MRLASPSVPMDLVEALSDVVKSKNFSRKCEQTLEQVKKSCKQLKTKFEEN